ncbi:hypothetical protein Pfo_019536 [Paulownia fortunei]|nr:hypothetical protein Pfo_019536 [Paulownia fortunei]
MHQIKPTKDEDVYAPDLHNNCLTPPKCPTAQVYTKSRLRAAASARAAFPNLHHKV